MFSTKKHFVKKLVCMTMAGLMLIGLLVSVGGCGKKGFTTISDKAVNASGVTGTIKKEMYSFDKTVGAVLADYVDGEGGTLYYINSKGATKVAEKVLEFSLSVNGAGLSYIMDPKPNELAGGQICGDVWLYLGKDASSKKVYVDVPCGGLFFTTSVDGRSVVYISSVNATSASFNGYVGINGRLGKSVGKKTVAFCTTSNGNEQYAIRTETNVNDVTKTSLLYRTDKGVTKFVMDIPELTHKLYFNASGTQCVYSDAGVTYANEKGVSTKLFDGVIKGIVLPENTYMQTYTYGNSEYLYNEKNEVVCEDFEINNVPTSTFVGVTVEAEDGSTYTIGDAFAATKN